MQEIKPLPTFNKQFDTKSTKLYHNSINIVKCWFFFHVGSGIILDNKILMENTLRITE